MPHHKYTPNRRRKFIRKDSVREYQSRANLIPTRSTDGTETYFKPSDIVPPEPPIARVPCTYCGKPTIRVQPNGTGDLVPTCVMCGISHAQK